jgi:hypothetical protein
MRVAEFTAQLERIFASIRGSAIELTHKQAVALSGEVYRLVVDGFEMYPGEPEDWEAWKGFHWAAMEGRIPNPPTISWREIMNERNDALGIFGVASGPVLLDVIEQLPPGDSERSLEVRFGLLTSWVLARHGLEVTPSSRLRLLRQVAEAALDAGWAMKRASQGDYTPDPKANRFPPIVARSGRENVTLTNLFDRWQAETKPAASTLSTWRGVVRSLREHLKHDDVGRITADDVIGWKDSLVAAGRSAKTINDGHLAALRALLAFGVSKPSPAYERRRRGPRRGQAESRRGPVALHGRGSGKASRAGAGRGCGAPAMAPMARRTDGSPDRGACSVVGKPGHHHRWDLRPRAPPGRGRRIVQERRL